MKKRLLILMLLLPLATLTSFAQLPSYLPLGGLTAWFPFTGNAIDSTGNGHDGVVHGTAMTSGRYGQPNTAFFFNGTSDYIYVPPGTLLKDRTVDITASLTISAWVKSRNYFLAGQEQIYWRGDATSAHDPHMLYFNGSEVRIRRDVDPGTTSLEVGASLTTLDTNYHMLTGTYDSISGVMAVYIDGMLKNSAVLPGLETYPTSTMYNYIGAVDGGTWQFFYGAIDELAIWRRALTACEIAALYQSVAHLPTSQPADDTVTSGGSAIFTIHDTAPTGTYQWQVDTGSGFVNLANVSPYSGVYTATLTVSPADTTLSGYLYRCIPLSGTCLSDTSGIAKLLVTPPSPLVVATLQNIKNVAISPNPNNGVFTITCTSSENAEVRIEITDLIGQIVYSDKALSQNGKISKELVLNRILSNGTYFLRIRSDSGITTMPFVIQY